MSSKSVAQRVASETSSLEEVSEGGGRCCRRPRLSEVSSLIRVLGQAVRTSGQYSLALRRHQHWWYWCALLVIRVSSSVADLDSALSRLQATDRGGRTTASSIAGPRYALHRRSTLSKRLATPRSVRSTAKRGKKGGRSSGICRDSSSKTSVRGCRSRARRGRVPGFLRRMVRICFGLCSADIGLTHLPFDPQPPTPLLSRPTAIFRTNRSGRPTLLRRWPSPPIFLFRSTLPRHLLSHPTSNHDLCQPHPA